MFTLAVVAMAWTLQGGVAARPPQGDRPQVSVGDFKALLDHNIFSPPSPPARPVRIDKRIDEPKKIERPKPPVVTGFVWDSAGQAYQAIVEDRNESKLRKFDKAKFLKAGDELEGCTVESIDVGRLVLKHGDATKEIRVGESFPASDKGGVEVPETPSEPSTSVEKTESKPVDASEQEKALRELKERLKKRRD